MPGAEIRAAWQRLLQVYQERGWGWGMAAFISLLELRGPVPEGFGAEAPDPARQPRGDGRKPAPVSRPDGSDTRSLVATVEDKYERGSIGV